MVDKPNMRGNPPSSDSASPSKPPSLASRIQSSATGLARSTLRPGPDQTSTLSSNNKAEPSSSTSHVSQGSIAEPATPAGPKQQSFRSSASATAIPDDFQNTIQLDDIDNEDVVDNSKGKGRLESAWQATNQATRGQDQDQDQDQGRGYNLQSEDGAAVVTLLSSSSLEEDPALIPDIELDPTPLPLSINEQEALDSFRLSFDGPRLTSSSLVPDIDTFLSQGIASGDLKSGTALRDEVLARLPGAGDWVDVQERYHDEVWGFLEPVLEAARTEMEQGESQEGPAVRRLRMILGHMGR